MDLATKNQTHHLRRIFIPTRAEALGLLAISTQALIIINVLPAIKQVEGINVHSFSDYLSLTTDNLLEPLSGELATTIFTYLLWMTIGICVYLIYWMLLVNVKAYRADLPPTARSIIPKGTDKKGLWHQAVARMSVRFLSSLGFLYWLYLLVTEILPYCTKLFLLGIGADVPEILYFLPLSVALLSASIFISIILLRLMFLRERIF